MCRVLASFRALQRLCWAAFQFPPFCFPGLTIQHSFYYNAFLLHLVHHINSQCLLQIYKKQIECKRGAVCGLLCLKLSLSLLYFLITFIYRVHVCMYTHTHAHTQWVPTCMRVELKEQLNGSHFSPSAMWSLNSGFWQRILSSWTNEKRLAARDISLEAHTWSYGSTVSPLAVSPSITLCGVLEQVLGNPQDRQTEVPHKQESCYTMCRDFFF